MAPVPLGRDFYARPTAEVARGLLGQVLATRHGDCWVGGTIVETEAYLGREDPASHAHRGPTPRAAIMFGPPGVGYVYFVYGMHHCLNAVTEPEGTGGAVLFRALLPDVPAGLAISPIEEPAARLRGPGLVCRALGISLAANGCDLAAGELRVFAAPSLPDARVLVGPRVGISRARELPLRFRLGPSAGGRRSSPRS